MFSIFVMGSARMNRVCVILWVLLIVFCGSAAAPAQEVVIPFDHYPPWRFTDARGDIEGIDIQLARTLLENVGLPARFVEVPWKRCLAMLESGEGDLLNGVLWSKSREKYMYFLQPPYKNRTVKAVYVRKGGTIVDKYEDLHGLVIGTTLGAKYFPQFDKDVTLTKDVVKHDLINLRKLLAGHIDCFIATEETGDYLIRENKVGDLVVKAKFKHEEPTKVYFTISRKSWLMDHVPELSRSLSRMIENGSVERIIGEYLRGL
ncbi:substrate-binding periplasmic protein [Pseudodesulfovibrio sp.]|uniref:substrate-binding periplasmic protein n=1 Tax=unclassified Pseudodesulfovibrio TaxID=2661612 RepID=UPI003B00DB2B